MKKIIVIEIGFLFSFMFFCMQSYAQPGPSSSVKRSHAWWKADWKKDSLPGISLDEACNYLKGRKSKSVIVALIDGPLDINHNDLKIVSGLTKKRFLIMRLMMTPIVMWMMYMAGVLQRIKMMFTAVTNLPLKQMFIRRGRRSLNKLTAPN